MKSVTRQFCKYLINQSHFFIQNIISIVSKKHKVWMSILHLILIQMIIDLSCILIKKLDMIVSFISLYYPSLRFYQISAYILLNFFLKKPPRKKLRGGFFMKKIKKLLLFQRDGRSATSD
jgi:hypothetical protein